MLGLRRTPSHRAHFGGKGPLTHLCDLEVGYGSVSWAPNFLVGLHQDSNPGPPACESGVVAITLRGPPLKKILLCYFVCYQITGTLCVFPCRATPAGPLCAAAARRTAASGASTGSSAGASAAPRRGSREHTPTSGGVHAFLLFPANCFKNNYIISLPRLYRPWVEEQIRANSR